MDIYLYVFYLTFKYFFRMSTCLDKSKGGETNGLLFKIKTANRGNLLNISLLIIDN